MRKRELEKFQKQLTERREKLLTQAARLAGEGRTTVSQGGEDYVDDAVTHYTREFLLSMSDLERRQLAQVEHALRRIRSGEYGECDMCGETITLKRLQAIPWARHCVACQELQEREALTESSNLWGLDLEPEADEERPAPTPKKAGGGDVSKAAEEAEG